MSKVSPGPPDAVGAAPEVRLFLEGSNAMKDVIDDVDRWVERGDKVALATVVAFSILIE